MDDDLEWAAAEGGEDPEEWECVACGKSFRSEAAWDSHERSKKHMKEVERLKREMEEDDEELGLAEEAELTEEEEEEADEDVDEPPGSPSPDEVTQTDAGLPSPGDHESAPAPPEPDYDGNSGTEARTQKDGDGVEESPLPLGRTGKRKGKPPPREILTKTEKKMASMPIPGIDTVPQEPAEPIEPQVELSKREKRRLREAKKAQATDSSSTQAQVYVKSSLANYLALIFLTKVCNVCQKTFESKTKLFNHINDTGHALAVSALDDDGPGGQKKKKKGKR